MSYAIHQIAEIIGADIIHAGLDHPVDNLLIDSRKLFFPSTSAFFAINGPVRRGTDYIPELYEKQVRVFVIDKHVSGQLTIDRFPEATFLLVDDVIVALQQLATFHRKQFHFPLIGITGSNGKTIVKEWLYQILNHHYHIVRSPKSYNSQIGVPLSVWQMNQNHELGLFEAGISMPGEMERLERIISPEIGLLTYMGEAHAEAFTDFKHKLDEKLKLFLHSNSLVYCADDLIVNECVQSFSSQQNKNIRLFSWGKNPNCSLVVGNINKEGTTTHIECSYQSQTFAFIIPFTDDASVFNVLSCVAMMLLLGMDLKEITAHTNELKPVEMRLEMKPGINQSAVINDSYNADIDSLRIALDFLTQQHVYSKKTVVISDFSGYQDKQVETCQLIASIVSQKKISRLIGIGKAIKSCESLFDVPEKYFFENTDSFLQQFHSISFTNEAILLKGSRIFGFEKIASLLEQKLHDTVLEINLNALRQNLGLYRKQIGTGTGIMAMVKAFSYGSGSLEIANLLQNEAVAYLSVAYVDEGVELRKGGIRLPIMVMNSTEAGFDNLILYGLEPEIYSFRILKQFADYLKQKNINQYKIHLKLDTGMHRLGFTEEQLDPLCKILTEETSLKITSVFSHLVASEDPEQDNFTSEQAVLFTKMADVIEKKIGYKTIRHLANSAAIIRHPGLQFDMVRLGIGLYGADSHLPLKNVTTLKTTIAQIKKVKAGESVGYGRKGKVDRDSIIATVRIGYADGYSRAFGNGIGSMLVNGKSAPVIGNVCMDMTMLDITGVEAEEGEEVIVFGEFLPVKVLANWARTIPYEILTNISQRVKRVYFEE